MPACWAGIIPCFRSGLYRGDTWPRIITLIGWLLSCLCSLIGWIIDRWAPIGRPHVGRFIRLWSVPWIVRLLRSQTRACATVPWRRSLPGWTAGITRVLKWKKNYALTLNLIAQQGIVVIILKIKVLSLWNPIFWEVGAILNCLAIYTS